MLKKNFIVLSLAFFFSLNSNLSAQTKIILSGQVIDSYTKQKVDFATIAVLELKEKVRLNQAGQYSISLSPGVYTLLVSSTGYQSIQEKIKISDSIASLKKDFILSSLTLKGEGLIVTDERDLQKVSRRTMTVQDLKETPASLGDSMNALTSLPGIDRTDGFFGPLVIRGADPVRNKYLIDGMPINKPMHFMGLHSVIANDLMSEIDLFSSSFPSKYGGALAAVIEINTLDSVKEFGGCVDLGLISGTVLFKTPLEKEYVEEGQLKKKQAGYLIASGRVGYLSLMIPFIYETFMDKELTSIPEYYDYQSKLKYFFNSEHNIRFLFIGSKDYWKLLVDDFAEVKVEDGDDPLLQNLTFKDDSSFHNIGIYYDYNRDYLSNTFMSYASFNKNYTYFDGGEGVAEYFQDFYTDSQPNIYGFKDNLALEWWPQISKLRAGLEFTYYDFKVTGWSLITNTNTKDEGEIDLADENALRKEAVDISGSNKTLGGFLDNKFTFKRFIFTPGLRFDYLNRSKQVTYDPRALASYEFPTQTVISLAGGRYSYFFQTNPFLFNMTPDVCFIGDKLKPERAWHSVFGLEQKVGLYTFGIETFYNYFYDLAIAYPHLDEDGEFIKGTSTGKNKAYGFEIMWRKDKRNKSNDYFGWLSYTYTQSKEKSGVDGPIYDMDRNPISGTIFDPNWDSWSRMGLEREHSLKMVLGYTYQAHTFSGRFQLYSSFPYTEIIGYEKSPEEDLETGPRYAPVYSEDKNTEHFPLEHRLDLRYSYQTNYKWGYVKWYIEFINIYGFWYQPANNIKWKYNEIYQKGKNPVEEAEDGVSVVPNFGVEIKF